MDEPRASRASGLSPCRRLACRGKRYTSGLAMPESLTGRFDLDLLETTLNRHAADGWRLVRRGRRVQRVEEPQSRSGAGPGARRDARLTVALLAVAASDARRRSVPARAHAERSNPETEPPSHDPACRHARGAFTASSRARPLACHRREGGARERRGRRISLSDRPRGEGSTVSLRSRSVRGTSGSRRRDRFRPASIAARAPSTSAGDPRETLKTAPPAPTCWFERSACHERARRTIGVSAAGRRASSTTTSAAGCGWSSGSW